MSGKKNSKKQGALTTNGVVMEAHEYATINILLKEGIDVELVEKSRTPHNSSPDIMMLGMFWEIKSPNGKTTRCVEHALRRATHQSSNIIIDLRRISIADPTLITFVSKQFFNLRSVRNLWIITKKMEIAKLKK